MIKGILIGAIIFGSIGIAIGGWLGCRKRDDLEAELEYCRDANVCWKKRIIAFEKWLKGTKMKYDFLEILDKLEELKEKYRIK